MTTPGRLRDRDLAELVAGDDLEGLRAAVRQLGAERAGLRATATEQAAELEGLRERVRRLFEAEDALSATLEARAELLELRELAREP